MDTINDPSSFYDIPGILKSVISLDFHYSTNGFGPAYSRSKRDVLNVEFYHKTASTVLFTL